jgi:hypothetical protein
MWLGTLVAPDLDALLSVRQGVIAYQQVLVFVPSIFGVVAEFKLCSFWAAGAEIGCCGWW